MFGGITILYFLIFIIKQLVALMFCSLLHHKINHLLTISCCSVTNEGQIWDTNVKNSINLSCVLGYLLAHSDTTGLYMGNANITPRNPRKYLYHAYLSSMESHGHQKPISLTAFGKVLPNMMSEYRQIYLKGGTKQGIQTNLELKDESDADWLPKCESVR